MPLTCNFCNHDIIFPCECTSGKVWKYVDAVQLEGVCFFPDAVLHFKILVPSAAAGAIIGKGGETIAQLQKEAGARVKMSKANDFYPGRSNFRRISKTCLCVNYILHVSLISNLEPLSQNFFIPHKYKWCHASGFHHCFGINSLHIHICGKYLTFSMLSC